MSLAYKLAFESPLVTADCLEAIEFPYLNQRYQVRGVPKTVINETTFIEGAVPENNLLDAIKKAIAD